MVERHAKVWRWYRRCAQYAASTSTPVVEYRSASTTKLRKDPRYAVDGYGSAFFVPSEWTSLYSELSPPGLKTYGTAFLGERRTAGGAPRLVGVDVTFDRRTGFSDTLVLWWRVIQPGPPFRLPKVVAQDSYHVPASMMFQRVYAGQIDPSNRSHFTITIEVEGKQRVLDGWLREDDTISMEQRTEY
jgi:hypothetical protein